MDFEGEPFENFGQVGTVFEFDVFKVHVALDRPDGWVNFNFSPDFFLRTNFLNLDGPLCLIDVLLEFREFPDNPGNPIDVVNLEEDCSQNHWVNETTASKKEDCCDEEENTVNKLHFDLDTLATKK